LQSVLEQDPGCAEMQITVIDDASLDVDTEPMVRTVAGDRVQFLRNEKNCGLAGCWNRCIECARGEWVHILHQDDYVLPGFYERLKKAAADHPDVQFLATRSFVIGDDGIIQSVTARLPDLENGGRSARDFYYSNSVHCPGVAVRRDFYQNHGGFRTDLSFTIDVEMWTRVITEGGGVVVPEVLAAYRIASDTASAGMVRSAEYFEDMNRLAAIFAARYPDFDLPRARLGICAHAIYRAQQAAAAGDEAAASAMLAYWKRNTTFSQRARFHLGGIKRRLMG
jgi:GT2 family glycosyltransferase